MKVKPSITRRTFLKVAASASAAPLILPRRVLGAPGQPGANDRIVTGHIGVGGMGFVHLRALHEDCGAICDVDRQRVDRAIEAMGRPVEHYTDFRRVLDRNDIDAVIVATPDHWHALVTILACQSGKDVYCEKPACKTIEEGLAMTRAARYYRRVVQVGAQGRSSRGGHAACQYIRNGQIGTVDRVVCWHEEDWAPGDPAKFGTLPETLDWDLWLGPSAWKPYNPDYVHFNFRWMMDWGGGFVRDRGAHVLSTVLWALDMDHKMPRHITVSNVKPRAKDDLWDTPLGLDVIFQYEDPNLTIEWRQPGEPAGKLSYGATFFGSQGSLVIDGAADDCVPEQKALDYTPPENGVVPFLTLDHRQHWLDCIRTRQRPNMDIEIGCRVASTGTLANIAYRLGRQLEFDQATMRFVNDEQADRLLANPGRGPWQL